MMKPGYNFIYETLQGKRNRPKKFRHYLKLNLILFDELVECGVVKPVELVCDETAYFEFEELSVTISFIHYWQVEDTHVRILNYLVKKFNNGKNPVIRGGHSSL